MPSITRPAVEVQQGHLTLYLTYVTPADLMLPRFYDVERLEPRQGGYQRILNPTRGNRLSRHLVDGFSQGYANLLTTIFLATDKQLRFDSLSNQVAFETEEVCPFRVVDGQHRIYGLIKAAEQNPALREFKLPATIATSLDDIHQMYHFYIVNTMQQSIETALQQQITSRFTDMQGVDDLPYLPHWLESRVSRGTDAQSIRLAEFLNEEPSSPLYRRIQMANDTAPRGSRIAQASICRIFNEQVFTGTNPVTIRETDPMRRNRIMLNYFCAIDRVLVRGNDPESTLVFKNNGLYFMTVISKWVFTEIYARGGNFTIDSIVKILEDSFAEMDDPYSRVGDSDWWMSGGGATGLNRAGVRTYANEFLHGLQMAQSSDNEGE